MSAQKDFSISRQKRSSISAMHVCVPAAQYSFWGSKKFRFLFNWSKGLQFWRECKFNSRCSWRCVLSRWVLFQQKEMRISWRLCNNSKIHLCLWKVWSLVVSSRGSFYVIRARKDDKNRQTRFFLLKKMFLLPEKQLFIKVPSRNNFPPITVTRIKKT